MKVLNLEDNVYKQVDMRKALDWCGVNDVDQVENMEDGFRKIYELSDSGETYDVIITDMHYPLSKDSKSDFDVGKKLLKRLKEENINIPIIVCSSRNFKIPGVFGEVWYHKSVDINWEFKKLLEKLKK